jgi:1,4-alpha-glucan branching enzyme
VFNTSRDEVRNFLVANALYWIDEFHIDGLRVDAVASMLYRDYSRKAGEWIPNERGGNEDLVNVDFLREVNTVVGSTHPGVLMIAEESTAWPGVTAPADAGGLGFTHKWNMGWMHDTLSFSRREPVHRRHHHGELPFTLLYAFSERYVLPLSHDEVVHGKGSLLAKMSGDDWQKFATLRLLYAWQWALPGSPLLFMGSELAPWSEWRHDRPLDWNLIDHEPHRGVHDLVARLNHTVERHPALWERDDDPTAFEWLEVEDADHSVYALLRWAHEGRSAVAAVANWTPVPRPGYRLGVPWGGEWKVLIDTDSTDLWGSGARGGAVSAMAEEVPWQGRDHSVVFDLPPLAMVWFGADAP